MASSSREQLVGEREAPRRSATG